jgi:AP-1 complex subunit sigma 1/2|eukprot:Stramenopile-MAST_4_protein_4395
MMRFMMLVSRQGKVRLTKWYRELQKKDQVRTVREVTSLVLARPSKQCNFIDYKGMKIVYKRYASLYFIACIEETDNELLMLEKIHLYVEVLDRYFGNVCELDIIFNFHKAYYILDEIFIGGQLVESSKREVLRVTQAQDEMQAEETRNSKEGRRGSFSGF